MSDDTAYENTDVHLWPPGPSIDRDFYAPSCHGVAGTDSIGINVGGYVVVAPLRTWHALSAKLSACEAQLAASEAKLKEAVALLSMLWDGAYSSGYKKDFIARIEAVLATISPSTRHEPTALGFRCKCGRDWPCALTTIPDARLCGKDSDKGAI